MDKKEIRTIKDAAEYKKIRANRPALVKTERKIHSCLNLLRMFRKLICEEGKALAAFLVSRITRSQTTAVNFVTF